MTDSILNSTKKVLGFNPNEEAFDVDIMMHINSVFMNLQQLGIGPVEGYMINGADETWDEFLGNSTTLNATKTYVYLRVRLLVDPPTTSFAIDAMNKQAEALEWRLNVQRELETHPISYANSDSTVWSVSDNSEFPEEAEDGDVGYDPATGNLWRKL